MVDNGTSIIDRLMSRSLVIMVLTHTLVHAAGNMRTTLFPVLKEEFALTNQQVGLIVAIPSLIQFLVSIPSGMISDKFGPKRIIAASILIATIGAVLGSLSYTPWMYIIASTLLTFNSTLYHPPAQSYVSDITNPKDRSRALGIWHSGGTTGVSLGPLSITLLMGVLAFTWRQVYAFWIIPTLLGLAALYFVKSSSELVADEEREGWQERDFVDTLLNRNMLFLLLAGTVRRFGGGLTTGFLSIWLVETQGWTVGQVGMMLGISSLIGIVASPLGGELASRIGEKPWYVGTLLGSYILFALAFLAKGFWSFFLLYIGSRFFGILGMPANMTLTARFSPRRQRGVGFALSSIPMNVAMPVAALVAAYIADNYGLYPIFMTTAVIYFISLGILQFGVRD
ncbi:MFS transporter [Candidatus Bathyarchaeota archaeon]|nr:MFS transporter [Candidatus Bathyarchaeota archaeon]